MVDRLYVAPLLLYYSFNTFLNENILKYLFLPKGFFMKGENLNMNKFLTKIIGASLAIAMMIGGAVCINAAKEAKEANADSATMSAGSNSAAINVSFNEGAAVNGVRIGTSKSAGSATFTVPMNTTSVSF